MEGRRRLSGAFSVEVDRIEPDPNQPRKTINPEYLAELTQSISRHGVLQPISVRYLEQTHRYRIVAGECRFTAAKRAGLQEIPCWVKSPKENEILVQQVVENWLRSDLNAFELADSLAILRDANRWNQQQLASETGKSKSEISKLLSILDLDPDVQSVARKNIQAKLSKRHLYALSRWPIDRQKSLLPRIDRDGLTARDVERMAEREAKRSEGLDTRGLASSTVRFEPIRPASCSLFAAVRSPTRTCFKPFAKSNVSWRGTQRDRMAKIRCCPLPEAVSESCFPGKFDTSGREVRKVPFFRRLSHFPHAREKRVTRGKPLTTVGGGCQ